MWLAIALHDRFGWPIEGALSDHPMYRDDPWLDRAFVRMTDGHALDIAGIDGPQDLSTGELLSIPVTREFLLEKLGGEDPLKEAEAIQIIDKWIVPCYLTTILDLTKEP
jgi:hypothetical protein